MENKICFLFGHSNTDWKILSAVLSITEKHYTELGIRTFIVGSRGNFDHIAAAAIRQLKEIHADITLLLLLSYHPGEVSQPLPPGFDGSYYPFLSQVPRQFAIVKANRLMVDRADTIICYVHHVGNARNLLEYACGRKRIVDNLANVTTD